MVKCPYCGAASVENDARFCPSCGGNLVEAYKNAKADTSQGRSETGVQSDERERVKRQVAYEIETAESKATASMILGIISIFFAGLVLGIISIVLGVASKKVLDYHVRPNSSAVSGIVCGIIGIVLWSFALLFVFLILPSMILYPY